MTTDIRALLADDGYAASFQSMGQYRTALLAALRAQADARPAFYAADDLELPIKNNNGSCRIFVSNEPFAGCSQAFYTHPEASAPGLSSQEILAAARAYVQPYGWLKFPSGAEFVELVQSLIRASAATVAEPSEQERMNELTRASAAGQAEGIKLGIAMQKDIQAAAREKSERDCRHCGWMCRPNDATEKKFYPLEPQAAQQRAEPTEPTQKMLWAMRNQLNKPHFDSISNRELACAYKAARATAQVATEQQAEPVGDERAAYHVEHRTNMCSEVVDANGNVFAECSWSTEAAKRAQRVCDALNAAQSGQRAGVAELREIADNIVQNAETQPKTDWGKGYRQACTDIAGGLRLRANAAAPTPAAQGGV